MKLAVDLEATGYFYVPLSTVPKGIAGGNPGAGHSFKSDDNLTHTQHLPTPDVRSNPGVGGFLFSLGASISRSYGHSRILSTPTYKEGDSRP